MAYKGRAIFWTKDKMCAVDYVRTLDTVVHSYTSEEMSLRWEFMQDYNLKYSLKLEK